jgi:hypothetical protein
VTDENGVEFDLYGRPVDDGTLPDDVWLVREQLHERVLSASVNSSAGDISPSGEQHAQNSGSNTAGPKPTGSGMGGNGEEAKQAGATNQPEPERPRSVSKPSLHGGIA